MPALLTSSGRPGFYFRVLQEGEVGAGDDIVKVGEAAEKMTVAEINALLYSSHHAPDRLQHALSIPALARGWRESLEALLKNRSGSGNAGLMPGAASHPAAPGFRKVLVTAVERESIDVVSFTMRSADDRPMPVPIPGQYVVVRLRPVASGPLLFRSYSISCAPSAERYRISVKIEPDGMAGAYLSTHVQVGDELEMSSPRGSFVLQPEDERPVVLLSAGIGATPVLAMLYELAAARSTRKILWLHAARDGEHHPFVAEVRRLLQALPNGRSYVYYSRPNSRDKVGRRLRRRWSFVALVSRCVRRSARLGGVSLWARSLHGGYAAAARELRYRARPDSRRNLQWRRIADTGHRTDEPAPSTCSGDPERDGRGRVFCSQRNLDALERVSLSEPAGVGGSV